MRRSILMAVLALAGALACGGSDFNDPTSHGSGSVSGLAGFTGKSAYAIAKVNADGSKDLSKIKFAVIGEDWSCADLRGSAGPSSSGGVLAEVVGDGGVTAGDYAINGNAGMTVFPSGSGDVYFAFDGTISVTAVDASSFKGSFDVTSSGPDGGTLSLTGNLDAPFCEVPSAWQ